MEMLRSDVHQLRTSSPWRTMSCKRLTIREEGGRGLGASPREMVGECPLGMCRGRPGSVRDHSRPFWVTDLDHSDSEPDSSDLDLHVKMHRNSDNTDTYLDSTHTGGNASSCFLDGALSKDQPEVLYTLPRPFGLSLPGDNSPEQRGAVGGEAEAVTRETVPTHIHRAQQHTETAAQSHTGQHASRMDYLLHQLKQQVKGLRHEGDNLTRQMWLLNVTFEDFLHIQYPEQSVTVLKKNSTHGHPLTYDSWLRTQRGTKAVDHTPEQTSLPTEGQVTHSPVHAHTPAHAQKHAHLLTCSSSSSDSGRVNKSSSLSDELTATTTTTTTTKLLSVTMTESVMRTDISLTKSQHLQSHSIQQSLQAHPPQVMQEFRRSHSKPRRRRTYGGSGHFYDSYTDKLVRDVVRLTFFGGDSKDNTPVGSVHSSPAHKRTSPVMSPRSAPGQHLTPHGGDRPGPPVRRLVSPPLTIYSSGYESDAAEYLPTKEEEIDTLFYNGEVSNNINSTMTADLTVTDKVDSSDVALPPQTSIALREDEYVISPDDLYTEDHSSFTTPKSTPSKHQTYTDLMHATRTPIKSDLNSPGRDQPAHQAPIQRSAPFQWSHPSGKVSSSPPRLRPCQSQSQSPSERKLTKVAKSMRYIITDLEQEVETKQHLSKESKQTLHSSIISETDSTFSPIQVPLTSTPVPNSEFAPTVTYGNYVDMIRPSQGKFHTPNKTLSASMNNVCEQQPPASFINIAHLTRSWPSTPDNGISHNRVLHQREGNQAPFEHQPLKLVALTADKERKEQFDNGRQQIKECSNQRGLIPVARHQPGHFRDELPPVRMCESVEQRTTGNKTDIADSMFHTSSSFTQSLITTAMLQPADSDTSVSDLSVADLVKESVQSIRVRPKELMFDEDYYLRPRTLEFNALTSSGSESSLCDGTLLLNHLQNSDFWNSQRSTTSSIGSSSSSPRNSTVSSDSGRGSTSAMDINELRCDSELDNSFMYDADTEPIYETIPDHLVSDENSNDSDATLCEGLLGRKNFVTMENTYATIDGDAPEGNVMCSSFHGYSPETPPEPPARNSQSRMTLPVRSSHQQKPAITTRGSTRRQVSHGIRRTDIISNNPYHVYTVGDVLESFHRLASNIPSSPPREEEDSLCHNVPTDNIYAQIRKSSSAQQPQPSRYCDIDTQRQRKPHRDRDSNNNCFVSSAGHRVQVQGHTGYRSHGAQSNSYRNTNSTAGNRKYNWNSQHDSHHQMDPRVIKTVSAPVVRPVWKPSVSQLQGTLC